MSRASYIVLATAAIAMACLSPACAGTASDWLAAIDPLDQGIGGIRFGARPGYQDGYDGQPIDHCTAAGVYMELFRANGPNWAGPTAFYADDLQSPIPDGGSKAWSDIYLWAQGYTPTLGDRVRCVCSYGVLPPAGYTGILTIDYVPASLSWTGPYEFTLNLRKSQWFYLPCPITDDPFNPDNVTRMHLTVYPVPEPSSLAALGLALTTFGAGLVRRRRK